MVDGPPPPDPLPQGEGEFGVSQLRGLIADCLSVWGVHGTVSPCAEGLEIVVDGRSLLLQRAPVGMRPMRWLLQTPERRAADRPPRAAPSIVAVLTALRHALGAEGGNKLRIGAAAQ